MRTASLLIAVAITLTTSACRRESLQLDQRDTGIAAPADLDEDQDGVPASEDCDDADPGVFPGAPERCNQRDDDCDGVADNEPVDALTFFADTDGDGWGGAETQACERPAGHVDRPGDCDDDAPTVHPSAVELCNQQDDDCDGVVDEDPVNPQTYYRDADADTFGDRQAFAEACAPPDGFVTGSTDCDDTNPARHPGADERCDGADDDCNGVIDDDPVDGFPAWTDDDHDTFGDPDGPLQVCALTDGVTDNADDCDDTNADIYPGSTSGCAYASCADVPSAGQYWVLDALGGTFEATCDAHGWARVSHLAAGARPETSIDRTTRFLHHPWIQGSVAPVAATSNADVVLSAGNYGMLDATGLIAQASELRWRCVDTTRDHTADGVVPLDAATKSHLLTDLAYDATPTDLLFTYDGVTQPASAYLTLSHAGYWGAWHICGMGSPAQFPSPDGWQLGFCATPPGTPDTGMTGVATVAMGYHPGFSGIRLECGNDTPLSSSLIDGELDLWLR